MIANLLGMQLLGQIFGMQWDTLYDGETLGDAVRRHVANEEGTMPHESLQEACKRVPSVIDC